MGASAGQRRLVLPRGEWEGPASVSRPRAPSGRRPSRRRPPGRRRRAALPRTDPAPAPASADEAPVARRTPAPRPPRPQPRRGARPPPEDLPARGPLGRGCLGAVVPWTTCGPPVLPLKAGELGAPRGPATRRSLRQVWAAGRDRFGTPEPFCEPALPGLGVKRGQCPTNRKYLGNEPRTATCLTTRVQ